MIQYPVKDSGWCVEDEREIQMCNLGRCNDEIWSENGSGRSGDIWSAWSDWDNCNDDNMRTRTRLCNFASGNCGGIDSFGGSSRIVFYERIKVRQVTKRSLLKHFKVISNPNLIQTASRSKKKMFANVSR